ncbi:MULTISPECIES: amino acid ABC transporter permease [unclassified Bradyrhizobium]|uniref:amino acid ABC transporter permease n=1 Tax=unclassified Bradyrhizobium TaxID=2631580 RepID=UPI0028EAA0B3|nr:MULTISPECIES: amino acid ABC transporter permease [unclassified Bradyrhizobium]
MMNVDLSVITRAAPFLAEGLTLSFLLTVVAMAGGIAIGLVLAVIRLSTWRVAALVATAYVNGFRAIPLVLVIFWFYFLVPLALGHPVNALQSAIIAFVLFEAAYYSEIIRAGLASVRAGQWQAASASGLGYLQSLRLVILPQALRNMLPVMISQAVILFQDTSLVYVISLRDFMTSASIVANRDNRLVEIYLFAALVYFVICSIGAWSASALNRKRNLA